MNGNGNGLAPVTQETIDAVKKVLSEGGGPVPGDIRKDITQAQGLVAYNLEPAAKLMVPMVTPLRNRIPRVGTGRGTAANWKAITALDINRAQVFTGEGKKAKTVSFTSVDRSAAYKTFSAGDNVSFQAEWAGRGFEDVRARMVALLLQTVMTREEQGTLGARNTALPAVTAPTVTPINGGGTIADATYNVFCRALVPMPGSATTALGRFSAATSTGALANGGDTILRATVPWVDGATRYEWYVGTAGNEKLEKTTTINSVELTALAGTGVTKAAVDAAEAADAVEVGVNGANNLAFKGLFEQLDGASGAYLKTLATGTPGVGTQLALTDIDDMLQAMWDNFLADPDEMYVNSEESRKITSLVLASQGAPAYFLSGAVEKGDVTAGYRVTRYINPVTGKQIAIKVHPHLHQGSLFVATFSMPFSASDISNPIELEQRQEYLQIDYPVTRTAREVEVLCDEVLKVYYTGGFGWIRNIAPTP